MDDKERSRRIPQLTRENHESWFREISLNDRAKDVLSVLDQTVDNYSWVPNSGGTGGVFNAERKRYFQRAEALALLSMLQSLSNEDAELIDEHLIAAEVWNASKQKYSKTNESSANQYLAKIATFSHDDSIGVNDAWAKLNEYRRKMVAANAIIKNAYPDAALLVTRSM